MATINFDEIFQTLKDGVATLAKDDLQDYVNEAKKDGTAAIDAMKTNLQQWAQEVENGAMTTEDLEFLLKEEESLDEMKALKEAGLAAVHIDQFRNGLINMILGTITGLVKV